MRRAIIAVLACGLLALVAHTARATETSSPKADASGTSDQLVTLVKKAGFRDLTECERTLLQSAPTGDVAYCGPSQKDEDPQNDPSKSDKWPKQRQISAKLIRWLCVNSEAVKLIDPKGIRIHAARVVDKLDLDFVSVPFPLLIVQSRVSAAISMQYADLKMLYLGGTWTGPVACGGLNARGGVFLRKGFHSDGEVWLVAATMGFLDCENATFSNPNGYALNADGIKVTGAAILRSVTATGEVGLLGATIGGDLDCKKGTFSNPNGYALNADGIKVTGDVVLRSVTAAGEVNLLGARIGGDLECSNAKFAAGSTLTAEGTKIARDFWWTGITDKKPGSCQNPDVVLDLAGASAAGCIDDEKSWPAKEGGLYLDGFTYERFEIVTNPGMVVPRDAESRLRWLRLQNRSRGVPTQPYQELARVLEGSGDEKGARTVRIAMEDDLLPSLPWYAFAWRKLLKWTVGYGYKPWIALWWALGFVLFGYALFGFGYRAGAIAPTDKDAFTAFADGKLAANYQRFNALVYSLDAFLPIINLGLKDRWMPNPGLQVPKPSPEGAWLAELIGTRFPWLAKLWAFQSGRALRVYLWFHLLLGWVLITLFAAGFTGIIRR